MTMPADPPETRYRLPLFPLPVVLLPGAPLPLHIFEPRYREMLEDCLDSDRRFGLIYHDRDRRGPFLCEEGSIGCIAEIGEHRELSDGRALIVVTGVERFRIVDGIESDSQYFEGLVTPYGDTTELPDELLASRRRESIELFHHVLDTLSERPDQLPELQPDRETSFLLAQTIGVDPSWHQRLLELRDEQARLTELDRVFRAALD
ncbi:MAG: LON peptidase substrate-binding domain-containing protein [Gemmatimonadota bacterium]|nr:LON peptidase substrate-binding domain-containing protein [Gemmatimonadota bacterium]